MFAPGIKQIADDLDATENGIIACQTGFVVMLGVGPLVLAPLSETVGRKALQIPTALATSLPTLVFLRTLTGFFGSMLHIIDAISSIDR